MDANQHAVVRDNGLADLPKLEELVRCAVSLLDERLHVVARSIAGLPGGPFAGDAPADQSGTAAPYWARVSRDNVEIVGRVLVVRVLPVLLAMTAGLAILAAVVWSDASAGGAQRLPDLDQETPSALTITRRASAYVLGFDSAVRNVGDGPLIVDAHRPAPGTDTMTADQLIDRVGGPHDVVPGVGRLRYVVSPDHRHWHLLGFDRYRLRRAGVHEAAVRDRKSGFCLGDRYRITDRRLRSAPDEPRYTSRCGLAAPGLLGIQEGISVGYGDDYPANLEGQYLRLSGLPGGRYVLVHRVNGARLLSELSHRNNAASLLLQLRWRAGAPVVRILRRCPDSGRCDRPTSWAD
jgi:Lysyl oxidase